MTRFYTVVKTLFFFLLALLVIGGNTKAQPRPLGKNVRMPGVIDATRAVHYYQFSAEAGDVVQIETFAQRLTPPSPLDTVLSLLSGDRQKVLAVNDDLETAFRKDSFISFVIPTTGPYVIKVESFESFLGLDPVGGPDFRYEIRWTTTTNNQSVYFPQIIDGVVFTTTILLVNNSANLASGSINLMSSEGGAFLAKLDGQLASSLRFAIPPQGTLRLETEPFGELRAGWAIVHADASLDGSVIFQAKLGDTIISEAGVGAASPTHSFTMFTDSLGSSTTGLAIANPGLVQATVTFTLRDKSGAALSSATKTLPPYEQTAFFTHELFSQVPGINEFEGSVDVASTSDVVAVTLRFDTQDLVFSTVPVVSGLGSNRIFFPQVADGANFRTTFILINNSDLEARGTLRLFHSDGTPFVLSLKNGPTASQFGEDLIRIPAHGMLRLESVGTGSALRTGWAEINANAPIGGNAIFRALDGNRIRSEAGVSVLQPLRQFVLFADTLGFASTGLAVANVAEQPANLTLRLLDPKGEEVSSITLRLGPFEHTARFIHELFRNFSGIDAFEGSVVVHCDREIVPIALRLDNRDHRVFTTLPVIIPSIATHRTEKITEPAPKPAFHGQRGEDQ